MNIYITSIIRIYEHSFFIFINMISIFIIYHLLYNIKYIFYYLIPTIIFNSRKGIIMYIYILCNNIQYYLYFHDIYINIINRGYPAGLQYHI